MYKVLVSTVLALTVFAGGTALAAEGLDNGLYEETHFFASNEANVAMPTSTPLSAESAALYEETPSVPVAAVRPVDAGEQLADSGTGQFRGWTRAIQATPSQVVVPE